MSRIATFRAAALMGVTFISAAPCWANPGRIDDYESTLRELLNTQEDLVQLLRSVNDRPSAVAEAPRARTLWSRLLRKGGELFALDPAARRDQGDDKTSTFQLNAQLVSDKSLLFRNVSVSNQYGSEFSRMLRTPYLRPLVLAYLESTEGNLPKRPRSRTSQPATRGSRDPSESGGKASVKVRQTDESDFPNMRVDFEVKNPDGSPLLAARQADFKVTESDEPVEILRFISPMSKAEARPTTVVLVVDHSMSMAVDDKLEAMQSAVGAFIKAMPQGCKVAVVAFSDEVETICNFTDDPSLVQRAVDGLGLGTKTRCFDALLTGLEMLSNVKGRRAILCLTDGEDIHSTATLDAVISAARRQTGSPIYTVGLGREEVIDNDVLGRLAEETRGDFSPAEHNDQLRSIFQEFGATQGQLYQIVYRTNRQIPDGTLRPVKVIFRDNRTSAGQTDIYIRGMVVPAPFGSGLFLALLGGLGTLAILPRLVAGTRA